MEFSSCYFGKSSVYCVRDAGVMELVDVVDSKSIAANPSAASGGCSKGVASAAVGEGRWRSRRGHSPGTANDGDIKLPGGSHLMKDYRQRSIIYRNDYTCRCDGIGRRSGLKIHRWRHRAGSSPATGTKIKERGISLSLLFYFAKRRTRTHLNATRTSVAADGLTEANLNFLPTGENANRVRPPAPKISRTLMGSGYFYCR